MDLDEDFEAMEVDEEPSRQSPSKTKEERRVAMDAQRAVIQSYAMIEGKTATDAYDHLCKVSQSQILRNCDANFTQL